MRIIKGEHNQNGDLAPVFISKQDMSSTANNHPYVPGDWGSFSEPIAHSPGNTGWIRPSAAPRNFAFHPGSFTDRNSRHSTNNRWPPTENWSSGSNFDVLVPYNNRPAHVPRPFPHRPNDTNRVTQDPWWLFENRVRTGPYGLNRFPLHPLSPMRITVLSDNEVEPDVNPRLRQFIQESPPRIRGQWNMQLASDEEESSLTREEQKKALKKLRKQVYDPYPKNRSRGWCLYYRDSASFCKNNTEQDDDGKSCAICLEDFVPKQEVLVTPCNHMFHDDCIIRWIKSNGQCPVCRFTLGEKRGEAPRANDPTALELLSLIRAMEEAFDWVNIPG